MRFRCRTLNPVNGESFDQRVSNEPSVEEQHPFAVNEDFLKLDDLISPQPALPEQPVVDNLPFDDVDGFAHLIFVMTQLHSTKQIQL